MEQTPAPIQIPRTQGPVLETINRLNARPVRNIWNVHKHINKLLIISYSFTLSSFIWAVINSYYLSTFFHTKYFFLLILGFLPLLPFMLLFFFLPFFLHRILRNKILLVLLVTFDFLSALLTIVFKDTVLYIPEFWKMCLVILLINGFSIYTLVKKSINTLLYTVAADILYSTKLLLIKTLFKRACINSFTNYYNLAALILHFTNHLNKINRQLESYLLVSVMVAVFLFMTSLMLNIIVRTHEFLIFGYLLCINNTKRKLRINTDQGELNRDYIELPDNDNLLSNGLNYLDIKQSLVDLKEKEVKEKYFLQPIKPFYFKYGPTPLSIPSTSTQEIVSREMIEAFGNSSPGFPLQVFSTRGSFVYSQLENTDIQQATNKFITLSFNNGYIGLIKDKWADVYTTMTSLTTRINILFIAFLLEIIYITRHPYDDIMTVLMLILVSFAFLSTSMRLVGTTNYMILGYSQALLCLLIGEQIELRNELKYERKLKRMLEEVCERDQIV